VKKVERVARMIAKDSGFDPDLLVSQASVAYVTTRLQAFMGDVYPLWHAYVPLAEAILKELFIPLDEDAEPERVTIEADPEADAPHPTETMQTRRQRLGLE